MQSGPGYVEGRNDGGRVVDARWMEENMPYMDPNWSPEEAEHEPGLLTARGLMYRGKWLISPERQERTVRLFWVSRRCSCDSLWESHREDGWYMCSFKILLELYCTGSLAQWSNASGRNYTAELCAVL